LEIILLCVYNLREGLQWKSFAFFFKIQRLQRKARPIWDTPKKIPQENLLRYF
jgi:hypothetical protein